MKEPCSAESVDIYDLFTLFKLSDFCNGEKLGQGQDGIIYKFYCPIIKCTVVLKNKKLSDATGSKLYNEHDKNILVHKGEAKLADFGRSKSVKQKNPNSEIYGSPAFIDPKCLCDNSQPLNQKSDIYSLGVILWEISSGHEPFKSLDAKGIILEVILGRREKPIIHTPLKYKELYEKCWDHDPEERPDAQLVYQDINNLLKPQEH
ncbi:kinase-like protein [Gigaspora margarita]|uniref:Kinase-like protein n=1 Tax=Gigaspora margarita TaxID=4874 RepID=A0A8H4AIB3_GIGMA|nr:kinase-like protein [Gigaspora margarita]